MSPVNAVQPELWLKSVRPLEIVEQAPHEVPAYIHAVIDCTSYPAQDFGKVGDPLIVILGSDPTFRQKDR